MRIIKALASFGMLQSLTLMALPISGIAGDVNVDHVRSVEIKAERLSELADLLSRIYQFPVCAEEARWFESHDDPPEVLRALEARRAKGFDIAITNAPLQRTLDLLVKQENVYTWNLDASNGVVNLYPIRNAPADWYVPEIYVQTQSVERLLFITDTLGLRNEGISFEPDRGNWAWMKTNTITLNTQGATLRDVLNSICAQLSEPRYWTISEVKDGSTFWDGTMRPVKYSLKFRLYQKYGRGQSTSQGQTEKIDNSHSPGAEEQDQSR